MSDRPEMWTIEAIVQAVRDGFTFLIPFKSHGIFQPNAYYIAGIQASAHAVTVGPHHTPDIQVTPEHTLQLTLYFEVGMVPESAFYRPPELRGSGTDARWVGPVHAFIMPEDIDWDWLNRGRQIRVPKGTLRRRNPYGTPEEVYTVLGDDDTFSNAKGSKVVIIYDKDGLLALSEDFDPDQDKGIRSIIRARVDLESRGLVKVIDIAELLHAYGINLGDDDDEAEDEFYAGR